MSVLHMREARKAPTLEYRVLIGVALVIFLCVELMARLVPRRWTGAGAGRGSILAEARASAYRTIPMVFMG